MKTALLVIDMQNDYLWEKRKKLFDYNTEKLVSSVNGLIRKYHSDGMDVIYIRHMIHDLPTNRFLRIAGEGYETLHLCGLDECGCVTATALGAVKRRIKAAILREGTATVFPEKKVAAAHEKLNKAGICFV